MSAVLEDRPIETADLRARLADIDRRIGEVNGAIADQQVIVGRADQVIGQHQAAVTKQLHAEAEVVGIHEEAVSGGADLSKRLAAADAAAQAARKASVVLALQ